MKRTSISTMILGASIAAGAAAATVAFGASSAAAAVTPGTYQLCLVEQYGSSAQEKCATYEITDTAVIGPDASRPLPLTQTPTGGRAEMNQFSWVEIVDNNDGTYTFKNMVLGIQTASSLLKPLPAA